MVFSTFQKRGFLREFRRQATLQQKQLGTMLGEILSDPVVTIQGGRLRVSTSSGEVAFGYSTAVGFTQAQILELISELLDRYDQAQNDLITAGSASPNDDLIYAKMMDDLRAIKGYTSNWMYLAK